MHPGVVTVSSLPLYTRKLLRHLKIMTLRFLWPK
uniref:Uncharacterized protein n=1 Tax=Anguilla anguilla TaxID=7936 RepID=A0A0E9W6N9_ANGAN